MRGKHVKLANGCAVKVRSIQRLELVFRLTVCGIVVLGLTACAASQLTSPFRSSSKKKARDASVSEERLLEAAKIEPGGQTDLASQATHCPRFNVWPRDRLLTIYEIGRVGDGLAIQHRGEITKTARECKISPTKVDVKYGFAGKVLLGPKGRPGQFNLPVKVHITDRTNNIVSTQNIRLAVTITPENPIGFFSIVREISIPLAAGSTTSDYTLFVAFDRSAPGAG